jgi:hypothetical protein
VPVGEDEVVEVRETSTIFADDASRRPYSGSIEGMQKIVVHVCCSVVSLV